MKIRPFLVALGLTTFAGAAHGANFEDLTQLLSTKKCPLCDLRGAGLVMVNLTRADLTGADLSGANLSGADLTGANLSGANLTSASLNGANLSGANLNGAITDGTDFREAYFDRATFINTNLETAYMQGAQAVPNTAGTPQLFYGWGLLETSKGNYQSALKHYDRALALDPEFAPGYLGRGLTLLKIGNEASAKQNVEYAQLLFEENQDEVGVKTSEQFLEDLASMQEARRQGAGNPQLDAIVRGVASMAFKYLLPLVGL
ncbi:pentapeptide repeat-containing protein [Synechocystis sp. LEGE 06083]|uniref:pentapeptide repeat-containing protein n=1 Tax=Synechocystis sp. LEGE 06083 TaxID=915336 RepID=UPI0018821E06|nr:pentapeptide repeat-containing protein [Synechocystis sp. LEGE 06083]MBE9194558.1 pentapeptide repeat-containing protein [Synechocystis sp. LEGE 06083]